MTDKPQLTEEQIEQIATDARTVPAVYQRFVRNLASDPANYNLSPKVISGLVAALYRLNSASLELDHFKRVMTYGDKLRINPSQPVNIYPRGGASLDEEERLLAHGILGKITEALELAPILIELVQKGTFDKANLLEELGDDAWYGALVEQAVGYEAGDIQYTNVKKLGKRYKGGVFTAQEALNRNLDQERKELEEGVRN